MGKLPQLVEGHLPMGRWVCSVDDVADAFVASMASSTRRADLWRDWSRLLVALRRLPISVPACWIGGSFTTDKASPGDVDCVFVLADADVRRALALGPREAEFLRSVSSSGVKANYGLDIDTYVLTWRPEPGVAPSRSADAYHQSRGYWDDLWLRMRDSDPQTGALPRRGYLEVIVDGYH